MQNIAGKILLAVRSWDYLLWLNTLSSGPGRLVAAGWQPCPLHPRNSHRPRLLSLWLCCYSCYSFISFSLYFCQTVLFLLEWNSQKHDQFHIRFMMIQAVRQEGPPQILPRNYISIPALCWGGRSDLQVCPATLLAPSSGRTVSIGGEFSKSSRADSFCLAVHSSIYPPFHILL